MTFEPTFSRRSKAVLADSDNDDGSADEEISNIAGDVANKNLEEPIISDEEEVARPTKTTPKVRVKKEVVTSDDDFREVEIKKEVKKVSKSKSRDGKKTSKKEALKSPNVEKRPVEDSDSDAEMMLLKAKYGDGQGINGKKASEKPTEPVVDDKVSKKKDAERKDNVCEHCNKKLPSLANYVQMS